MSVAWPAVAPVAASMPRLAVTLDSIEGQGFVARSVRIALDPAQGLVASVGSLSAAGNTWKNLRLGCDQPQVEADRIACTHAVLEADGRIPVSFSYQHGTGVLDVTLRPAAGESWRIRTNQGVDAREIRADVENGSLARVARWLPAGLPRIRSGILRGSVAYHGAAGRGAARLGVSGLAFSDADGLRAGEKVAAELEVDLHRQGEAWNWSAVLDWREGEVFWQPIYFKASGQALRATGVTAGGRTRIAQGEIEWKELGRVRFGGAWDHQAATLTEADAQSAHLALSPLYAQILKPYLQGTALDDLRMDGAIAASVQLRNGALHAADVEFHGVSLEDGTRRFALFGVNGRLPWHSSEATTADVSIEGGEVLRLPFGAARLPVRMQGLRFALEKLEVPLLDGKLAVNDFRTVSGTSGWRWRFRAAIAPISMERFTQNLGLPAMHGTLSAEIPEVRYGRSTLTVDGALLFRVFDGIVTANNLNLIEPFGRVPRLTADLEMRGLDLELLTRTYSFGKITGRADASIAGLELVNWQPSRFDAHIASSPGEYRRRISQAAVENITALGGAGATAAIQRSFLRFFEEFGYEKLGLSCALANNVCEMGGIEDAPQGYVIVKGGGIPAISVIGYNRRVDWPELIGRLRRIMQDNVRAIVK